MRCPPLVGFSLLDVLRLIRSENVGPVTFFGLIAHYGSPAAALEALPALAARGGRKKPLKAASREEAEREIEKTQKAGASFVLFGEANYPKLLQHIHDPPPVLAVRGNPNLLSKHPMLAIVGARNASASGCVFARKLASEIGSKQCMIVSGLARGIDTAAHQGSLSSGTIAVVAGGVDHIYPPENEQLFAEIAASGAIISEQPFGAPPHPRSFPARNRIISGISVATAVVEASLKSGSLITARVAAEQGREVFAVPGSPMDPRSKGCNQLLKEGANLLESPEDVLRLLNSASIYPLREDKPLELAETSPADEKDLALARGRVREKLGITPVLVDELISECQVTAPLVLFILLELELAGNLERHPGNRVSLHLHESYESSHRRIAGQS